jgi:hypothetical protein
MVKQVRPTAGQRFPAGAPRCSWPLHSIRPPSPKTEWPKTSAIICRSARAIPVRCSPGARHAPHRGRLRSAARRACFCAAPPRGLPYSSSGALRRCGPTPEQPTPARRCCCRGARTGRACTPLGRHARAHMQPPSPLCRPRRTPGRRPPPDRSPGRSWRTGNWGVGRGGGGRTMPRRVAPQPAGRATGVGTGCVLRRGGLELERGVAGRAALRGPAALRGCWVRGRVLSVRLGRGGGGGGHTPLMTQPWRCAGRERVGTRRRVAPAAPPPILAAPARQLRERQWSRAAPARGGAGLSGRGHSGRRAVTKTLPLSPRPHRTSASR